MLTRIASCHFYSVHAERPQYGGDYKIPAVPLGAKPHIIEVQDLVQHWDGTFESSSVPGTRRKNTHMVWGEVIADDIVRQWTTDGDGRTATCHPGIWVVREKILKALPSGQIATDLQGRALFDVATDEQIQEMWDEDYAAAKAADANYAKYLVAVADSMANDPRGSKAQFISPIARAAAEVFAPNSSWLRHGAELIPQICMYCQARVPAKVIKCPNCKEVVDVEGYAALQAQQKKAVREAVNAA